MRAKFQRNKTDKNVYEDIFPSFRCGWFCLYVFVVAALSKWLSDYSSYTMRTIVCCCCWYYYLAFIVLTVWLCECIFVIKSDTDSYSTHTHRHWADGSICVHRENNVVIKTHYPLFLTRFFFFPSLAHIDDSGLICWSNAMYFMQNSLNSFAIPFGWYMVVIADFYWERMCACASSFSFILHLPVLISTGIVMAPTSMGVIFMIEIHKSTDDRQNIEAIGKIHWGEYEIKWTELNEIKKSICGSSVSHTSVSVCVRLRAALI